MSVAFNVTDNFKVFLKFYSEILAENYMSMGFVNQEDVNIYLYKNIVTREYINIDEGGKLYKYKASRYVVI